MSMQPEDVLAALVAHVALIDGRRPDPLVEAVRESKVGNVRPGNWRAVRDEEGKIDVAASWPALRTALGRDQRRVGKEALHEAAADAMVKMPKRSLQTLYTAIGIDSSARATVIARLTKIAWQSQERDRFWPSRLERRRCGCNRAASPWYADDLVELAVLQLEHPDTFKTHDARADWFGLSNRWWRAQMQQPFDLLSGHVWDWYNAGIVHMENRLSRRRRETA